MRYHAASFSYACISTMHCPFCGAHDTKVIDSRLVAEGDQVRRRRECLACGERFTTGELVMAELQKLDEVAYIRFASVYRRFQDLNEFREEIERLAREPAKE